MNDIDKKILISGRGSGKSLWMTYNRQKEYEKWLAEEKQKERRRKLKVILDE